MPFEVAKDVLHATATATPLLTYFVMSGWSCQPRGYQEVLYVLQDKAIECYVGYRTTSPGTSWVSLTLPLPYEWTLR
jgi:hypothetical protein